MGGFTGAAVLSVMGCPGRASPVQVGAAWTVVPMGAGFPSHLAQKVPSGHK